MKGEHVLGRFFAFLGLEGLHDPLSRDVNGVRSCLRGADCDVGAVNSVAHAHISDTKINWGHTGVRHRHMGERRVH